MTITIVESHMIWASLHVDGIRVHFLFSEGVSKTP